MAMSAGEFRRALDSLGRTSPEIEWLKWIPEEIERIYAALRDPSTPEFEKTQLREHGYELFKFLKELGSSMKAWNEIDKLRRMSGAS